MPENNQFSQSTASHIALEEHIAHLEERIAYLEGQLPNTKLLSPNFLTRAFTVWAHYFVANLIIAIPIIFIGLILSGGW
ncbi:MAG: hypothetical protein AMJ93_12095 [Anaerolineae bacterium SM23_84]|nr:MAG: hypothetical protein AMJ93_12095 [Anaerolineae bacterium SM23_84]